MTDRMPSCNHDVIALKMISNQ